jgi:polysaccharide biosynthesis/export protein
MFRISPLVLLLFACSALPSAGPNSSEVLDTKREDIVIIDLDVGVVNANAKRGASSFQASFGNRQHSVEPVIAAGDILSITLFEAGAGGLFTQSNGSRQTVIPDQPVARDGAVSVPYAGRVRASGLTPRAVENRIIKALEGKAVQPQALVTLQKSVSSSVSLIAGEGGGGRIPLSLKGDRLLDVIATAGGLKSPAHETFVTLNRGAKTMRVPFQTILAKYEENIMLKPGDTITLTREPQTFTAAGATAKNALIPFEAIGITLEEAIAKAGGLLDQRSDPQGVFLLRFEPVDFVRSVRKDLDFGRYSGDVPVIYHVNLREPAGFFLSRGMPMRNKDMLYISNAPMSDLSKVFTLFNMVASPIARLQ